MDHPDTLPLISVIIPSWNRKKELSVTLESVFSQDYPNLEVIVVDNGSLDGTVDYIRDLQQEIVVIENPKNIGPSQARNQGIVSSHGELIVFMDSDASIIDPATFREMARNFQKNPGLGALSAPIYLDEQGKRPWVFGIYYFGDHYIDWERTHRKTEDPDSLSTCFVMVRRDAIFQTGGFDPVYFYQHEDLDFFLRFDRTGYTKALLPQFRIWHRHSFEGRKQDRWFWMHFREEWRHQYLNIKNKGLLKSLGYMLRNAVKPTTVEAYYVRPMRKRKFFALFWVLPALMLLASPWILFQRLKNPLKATANQMGRNYSTVKSPPQSTDQDA